MTQQTPSSRRSRPRRAVRPRTRTHSVTSTAAADHPGLETAEHDPTPIPFTDLVQHLALREGLADRGFEFTTPIQSAAIPVIRSGADLIGCAQTGTGKTAAFLLPIMERLLNSPAPNPATSSRALVLAPTRELVVQIVDDFEGLGYHTGLSVAAVYGGVPSGPQDRALRAAVDVVVATPGRLLDHLGTGACRFDAVEVLVLDEADRMLDMGFWPSVRRIVSGVPPSRQTLFFSATMSPDVYSSAMQIMREPKMVKVGGGGSVATTIKHFAHRMGNADKAAWLARFLRASHESAIVFVRTKRGADRLAERLARLGIKCAALHADRSQSQRTAAIEGFKAGRYTTLVATDVAARGLDIDSVGYVVNVEVPDTTDTYVHRVGRTGRALAEGKALTLVSRDDEEALASLERALGVALIELDSPGQDDAAIAS